MIRTGGQDLRFERSCPLPLWRWAWTPRGKIAWPRLRKRSCLRSASRSPPRFSTRAHMALDQLDDGRDELSRHGHHGLVFYFDGLFDFAGSFLVREIVV